MALARSLSHPSRRVDVAARRPVANPAVLWDNDMSLMAPAERAAMKRFFTDPPATVGDAYDDDFAFSASIGGRIVAAGPPSMLPSGRPACCPSPERPTSGECACAPARHTSAN